MPFLPEPLDNYFGGDYGRSNGVSNISSCFSRSMSSLTNYDFTGSLIVESISMYNQPRKQIM